MAFRYNQGFGLDDKERQEIILEKMSKVFDDFEKKLTNEEIKEIHNIDKVTISQLREEVTGNGFYNPEIFDNNKIKRGMK
jgi:endonuclease III-like uncharacterized protein